MGNSKNSRVFNFTIVLKSRKFDARKNYVFYSASKSVKLTVIQINFDIIWTRLRVTYDNCFNRCANEMHYFLNCMPHSPLDYSVTVGVYCKTLNVSVPFISRILRAKQSREIKGREYQLQAKIGRNYYGILNCMVLIR